MRHSNRRAKWNAGQHRDDLSAVVEPCPSVKFIVEVFEKSEVPCAECSGPVHEFSVPDNLWNTVVRTEGKEHDKEYLCLNCFVEKLFEVHRKHTGKG